MTKALDGSLFGPEQPCFGCAPDHPIGFQLRFDAIDDGVTTRFVPGDRYQGPPGIMHGGLVMTLADEIAAWAIIASMNQFGFTASAQCQLKRPVRCGVELIGTGRITKKSRRVVTVAVSIAQSDEIAFEAEMRFVVLDEKGAEKLIGGPLPDAWKQFSR